MTTEAQIHANRLNAQKSTGPRTPEGKEKASHNALKHGLLAKDVVVVGEDLDDFDLFRDQLRAELAPVGIAETRLVERIAGLFWRLQRAERFQTAAFDTLYAQCQSDPQSQRWRALPKPEGADPILGMTVVKDFSETRTLDRLSGYERRLEGGLYRTMAQLRQVQAQRQGAAGGLMAEDDRRGRRSHREPELTLDALVAQIAASGQASGSPVAEVRAWEPDPTPQDALGDPDNPAGGTTNLPQAQSAWCETNPIGPGESCQTNPIPPAQTGPEGQGTEAMAPNEPNWGSETCENTSLPGVVAATKPIAVGGPEREGQETGAMAPNEPNLAGETCQTNPIGAGSSAGQSLGGTGVRSDPAANASVETKPIVAAKKERFGYTPIFRRRR